MKCTGYKNRIVLDQIKDGRTMQIRTLQPAVKRCPKACFDAELISVNVLGIKIELY